MKIKYYLFSIIAYIKYFFLKKYVTQNNKKILTFIINPSILNVIKESGCTLMMLSFQKIYALNSDSDNGGNQFIDLQGKVAFTVVNLQSLLTT